MNWSEIVGCIAGDNTIMCAARNSDEALLAMAKLKKMLKKTAAPDAAVRIKIMLTNLHVKNIALIDEIDVEFERGLNIFTGETGAGKSLLLGSINLALERK